MVQRFFVFLLIISHATDIVAQSPKHMPEVRKILNTLKDMDGISYDYSLSVSFPDNSVEKLSGTSYFDRKAGISFNESDVVTTFYTKSWFYKADHHNKTVFVINLDSKENSELKKNIEKQVFNNGMLGEFLDSVIFAQSTLKSFNATADSVVVELAFPPNMTVKRLSFVYDTKKYSFLQYEMDLFFPTEQAGNQLKGSTQKIVCRNFQGRSKVEFSKPEHFFIRTKDGKVQLKKYTEYKLNPES